MGCGESKGLASKPPKSPQWQQPPSKHNFTPSVTVEGILHGGATQARGGKGIVNYPENCLETIQFINDSINAIFEVDVAQTKDSILVLMHDNSIDRAPTGSGLVKNKHFNQLQKYYLVDDFGNQTKYKIPNFYKVLNWAKDNNVVLTIDIKRSVDVEDVIEVVKSCEQCLLYKDRNMAKYKTDNLDKASFPFDRVAIDISGPFLTTSKGYRYIMAVIDYFSKHTILISLKNMTAEYVAKKFIQHWVSYFGIPLRLHSDRGTNFKSQVFKEVLNTFDINRPSIC